MGFIANAAVNLSRAQAEIDRAAETDFIDAATLDLAPVLGNPGKFICLGLNFKDHAAEGGFDIPDYPALFMRADSSLIGSGSPLVRPVVSETFDYEAELAVVIGETARHVSEETALSHVFGYSIFNDASVREYQRKTAQWTAGKNFDGTGAFGPAIVTADDLPPGMAEMRIQSRLNGKVLQDSSLSDMIFPVAETVSILSQIMTLYPGDVIAMGTPAGVGHARRPQLWMKPGDTCEVEIEGLGVLRNPVIDESAVAASSQAAE
ncbi:fumarylacetoacetate hydrolase family protein [Roseobacter sp. YSTF-M11]|uniref:Fumarylacetoacetate hydrolase family protein n=2 Tax=Roseobacter insulae TaxID=2859783 RepID=A0A9X1K007_9RHOB|nr:fumarylacetoacetate hydrolase family protein [Roseobacter insulae]